MSDKIHLFYLGSNSHIIVADGIIKEKELPLDSVYFITYRGVKLPPCYKDNLLYDETIITNRKKFFIRNYCKLTKIFKGRPVCAYLPFQQEFPFMKFFDEYVFFEEGLSAYDCCLDFKFNKRRYFSILLKSLLITPFFNKKIRALFNGRLNGSPFSFDCTLAGLTENSYKNVAINNCKHETIHFTNRPLNPSPIKDSVIIVMDSTHATDRMDSADNYLQILSDVLRDQNFGSRDVYLKLHPDNCKDSEAAVELIKKYINFIDFKLIDESLEDIALSNQNNIFFGNHSTILFYAPIFGKSNKSISFARINAKRDVTYVKFLQRWGGVKGALALFEQQIECL